MTFELGETVILNAEIRDETGALYAPATVKISIKAPNNTTVVDKASMTSTEDGKYTYNYNLPEEPTGIPGKYKYKVIATSETSLVTITTGEFTTTPAI